MRRACLLTTADLDRLPHELPRGTVSYELIAGRMVVLAPNTWVQATAASMLGVQLAHQGERAGHGRATMAVAIILSRNPDTVLVPHAVFIHSSRLPVQKSAEDYLESPPSLVFECLPGYDPAEESTDRAGLYLAAGVELVRVADPDALTVTAYRPNQPPQVFAVTDTLTADPVIPGFAVAVAELFRS